jgi:hypothetical protein
MKLITDEQWGNFRKTMKDAHDTFHQKPMLWKRLISDLDRYGEDYNEDNFDTVELLVLCNYNYMRSWPATMATDAGKLDRESVQVLINKDYLRELGYLNADGYFDFKANEDMFILDGKLYRDAGDTPVSQASNDDILVSIILKREETPTG